MQSYLEEGNVVIEKNYYYILRSTDGIIRHKLSIEGFRVFSNLARGIKDKEEFITLLISEFSIDNVTAEREVNNLISYFVQIC